MTIAKNAWLVDGMSLPMSSFLRNVDGSDVSRRWTSYTKRWLSFDRVCFRAATPLHKSTPHRFYIVNERQIHNTVKGLGVVGWQGVGRKYSIVFEVSSAKCSTSTSISPRPLPTCLTPPLHLAENVGNERSHILHLYIFVFPLVLHLLLH